MPRLCKDLQYVINRTLSVLLFICAVSALTQENILQLSDQSISSIEVIKGLNPEIKYQLGDNPEWAAPDFDDSDWPKMRDTRLMNNNPVRENWKGIGWFRIKYKADSSLINRPLFLATQQSCALEVYIDGNIWIKNGVVSAEKEGEECIVLWEMAQPTSMIFKDDSVHTAAVRYSHHPSWMNSREIFPIGFAIFLIDQKLFLAKQDKELRTQAITRWFFTGVPLTFALLHLLMFLFNRKFASNLHYAVFTLSCAGLTFFVMGSVDHIGMVESHLKYMGFKFSLLVMFVSGLRFLYGLFYDKVPRQYYVYTLVVIICIPFIWYITTLEIYLLGFIAMAEQLRVVIVANVKKLHGAKIIGLGYLIFAILCSLQMLSGFGELPSWLQIGKYPYLFGILGMLICMSIYLAREFAITQEKLSGLTITQKETIFRLENEMKERKKAEELTQKQQQELIQADKMATLGILVSGVAHEINNPNNYMLLNSNNLSDIWKDLTPLLDKYVAEKGDFNLSGIPYSEIKDEIPPLISSISEGSERIRKIVDSLKDFARKDPGTYNQDVEIQSVLEASTTILANMIKKATHHFSVDCPPGLPTVKGNFQQLEQVIINLISNSCQALENQNQKLTILVEHVGDHIVIQIEDTGRGIAEENLPHILDPFFTTNRDSGGTGLGLSITYTIVKDHNGTLEYESEVGKGTKAKLSLPVNKNNHV